MPQNDSSTYDDISKTIPDIGFGEEIDGGSTWGKDGGASVGDFEVPSAESLKNLEGSTGVDWGSTLSTGIKAVGDITKAAIDAGKGNSTSRTTPPTRTAPDIKITLPTTQPGPTQPSATQPAQPARVASQGALVLGGLTAVAAGGVLIYLATRKKGRR